MPSPAPLFQVLEAAGAEDGLIYLSVPITSGAREAKLMHELGCGPEELRSEHRDRWRQEVVEPNEEQAEIYAAQVRGVFPTRLVVDPSRLRVDWSQDEYNQFWKGLIERYAVQLVATPEWAFSRGARGEVALALDLGLPVLDLTGKCLDPTELATAASTARQALQEIGLSEREVDAYLSPFRWEAPTSEIDPELEKLRRTAKEARAAAEAFSWLRRERSYQLKKFGTALDDKHALQGLDENGWWWQQLTNYYGRARVLSLQTPGGRQALAKFVATGCGLLESTIRLFGSLPVPSVPSGTIEFND